MSSCAAQETVRLPAGRVSGEEHGPQGHGRAPVHGCGFGVR